MYFADYTPDRRGVPLPDVSVRPATQDDVPACAALLAQREGVGEDWAERLRFWLASGQQLFVAERAGTILGYARLAWQEPSSNGGRGAPDGYYLSGIIVDPSVRRRGIGRALTRARCEWTRDRGVPAYFVVNALNEASMDLHRELGFSEVTRDFAFPGVTFTGGEGVLFELPASGERETVVQLRVRAAG